MDGYVSNSCCGLGLCDAEGIKRTIADLELRYFFSPHARQCSDKDRVSKERLVDAVDQYRNFFVSKWTLGSLSFTPDLELRQRLLRPHIYFGVPFFDKPSPISRQSGDVFVGGLPMYALGHHARETYCPAVLRVVASIEAGSFWCVSQPSNLEIALR